MCAPRAGRARVTSIYDLSAGGEMGSAVTLSQLRRGAVTRLAATALAGLVAAPWLSPAPVSGAVDTGAVVPGQAAGLRTAAVPGARPDAVRTAQWQLNRMRATTAWEYSTGTGVIVAVLDSGVDARH